MRIQHGAGMSLIRSRQVRQAKINYRISAGKARRTKQSSSLSNSSLLSTSNNKLSIYDQLMQKLQSSQGNSNKNQTSTTTSQQKKNYTLLKQYASNVSQYGNKLLASGEDSLFAAATPKKDATTGDSTTTDATAADTTTDVVKQKEEQEKLAAGKEKVVKQITKFLDEYNDMVGKMNDIASNTNELYLKQLKQYETQNEDGFHKLGISIKKDGTLDYSEAVLKASDVADLKSVFGVKGSFADKVSSKSKYIESSAEYNLSNLNKVYNSGTYGKTGYAYDTGGSTFNARS